MRVLKRGMHRAQSMVEFAIMATVVLLVLAVAVQLAVIGGVDLALADMTYQGARYAASHEGCGLTTCTGTDTGNSSVQSYMLSVGWAMFTTYSSKLSISITPTTTPRTTGTQTTVSSTFTLPSSIEFLPNPFMGLAWLPTSLSSTEVTMSN